MSQDLDDLRLVPNLMRHEFETLVLAALHELERQLEPDQLRGLDALRTNLGAVAPEDVDDGANSAPSKRLALYIEGYRKLAHGVLALQAAGLQQLRAACPRFAAWVTGLEQLGRPA
jgi:hypothetical protein